VTLDDIELPPNLEHYRGSYDPTLQTAAGLSIESQPNGLVPDIGYFVGSADEADLDQWFSSAASRAGFEPPPKKPEPVWGSGRWRAKTSHGDQYLSWGTIPLSTGDGNIYYVFALYLTQAK
jgi:hypothetical protein